MLDMLDVAIGFSTVMLAVSLIIMSLTQAGTSLLALRGNQLRKGLTQLIEHACPALKDRAAELSLAIVTHPLVSDSAVGGPSTSRWKCASCIKREELIPVLRKVMEKMNLAHLPRDQEQALEKWFDSFMARVSQWFVMNTRWITVGLAVVIAFAMHLDSIAVIKQIQANAEIRGRLAAMSSSLLDQTPQAIQQVENGYREAVRDVFGANAGQFTNGTKADDLTAVTSHQTAERWIVEHARAGQADDLTRKLAAAEQTRLASALDKAIGRAKSLEAGLSSAGLSLFPTGHGRRCYWPTQDPSHFFGILASVLFLSLGAPFWFNTLKSFTSLKSTVALQEEEPARPTTPARRAEPPQPPAATNAPPPSTTAVTPPATTTEPTVAPAASTDRLPSLP
jgi:hypothetical protein